MSKLADVLREAWAVDETGMAVHDVNDASWRAFFPNGAMQEPPRAATRAAVCVLGQQALAWLMRMEGGVSSMSEEELERWQRDGEAIILAAQELRKRETT